MEVAVVVPVVVPVVVVVEVGVVVAIVVAEVVCELVGVVTAQSANPPTANASAMPFTVAVVLTQFDVSTKKPPKAQPIVGVPPAGPLNSRTA